MVWSGDSGWWAGIDVIKPIIKAMVFIKFESGFMDANIVKVLVKE